MKPAVGMKRYISPYIAVFVNACARQAAAKKSREFLRRRPRGTIFLEAHIALETEHLQWLP